MQIIKLTLYENDVDKMLMEIAHITDNCPSVMSPAVPSLLQLSQNPNKLNNYHIENGKRIKNCDQYQHV